ncbi:MAG TPA: NHLP family bacteriocin export ABC transporter peptidase/permease/ATPase subunit [Chloroflexota bacterium]|nr:NHLP family bacteriocin export ABC transporter peptidase/permease/ATPase subunit [Chloroflexota bacterium]
MVPEDKACGQEGVRPHPRPLPQGEGESPRPGLFRQSALANLSATEDPGEALRLIWPLAWLARFASLAGHSAGEEPATASAKSGFRRWFGFTAPVRRVRTPTIIQMERTECGAAALAIILAAHGRFVSLPELRVACGVTRDGSKAVNMLRAARSYGLVAKGYRKEPADLASLPLPFIVFWRFNHFVVVEGFDRQQVYLNDPATGPRAVTRDEFDRAFTGIVLTFVPGPDFQSGGARPGLARSLRQQLGGSERNLLYLILVTLAVGVPSLLVPLFLQVFVDDYLLGRQTRWLGPLLLGLAFAALLQAGLTWLQRTALLKLETRLALNTSSRLLRHLLRLPVEFYHQRLGSEIASRVALNDRLARLLSGELALAVLNALTVVLFAGLMLWYDRLLTLICVLLVALNVVILARVARLREDSRRRLLEERGKLVGTSVAGLRMIESLKITGGEADFFARWAGLQAKISNAEQDLGVATQPLLVCPPLLAALSMIAVLAVGGLRVMDGTMSVGVLAAFQTLAVGMMRPINRLVQLGALLQAVRGDWERLNDVYLHPPDRRFADGPEPDQLERATDRPAKLTGLVELRGVSFGYDRLAPPLIENLQLTLRPGARVALVGSTGSGKSTIARLVAGLYEPWSGEILFDGCPRDRILPAAFTRSLATVDQEIFLFAGTVRDNLTLWDGALPLDNLVRAARDAQLEAVIANRPGGYAAPVAEDGMNFSGGERQRLEIARALVRDPAILILDEATSALDPLTEQLIDDRLRQRGCACLIIAHRLSTVRDCDEIVVLERGRVVQRGTHADLIAVAGPYARFVEEEAPWQPATIA